MKRIPIPSGLRRHEDFIVKDLWYVANIINGLSMVEITAVEKREVFYSNDKNSMGHLPVGSSFFIHPDEVKWLGDVIRKHGKIKGVNRTLNEIFKEISVSARRGDCPESVIFINWLHRVQSQFSKIVKPEALPSAIEKLLIEVRKH